MKKTVLTIGQLYLLTALKDEGYKFVYLRENRKTNTRLVNKKRRSIDRIGGCIMPLLVVTARKCLEANLKLVDENGNEITEETPNVDAMLVIIDGQNRYKAFVQIREDLKTKGQPLDDAPIVYCMLPPEKAAVKDVLIDGNAEAKLWEGKDYMFALLMNYYDDLNKDYLEFVRELLEAGIKYDAAYIWAALSYAYIPSKRDLIAAGKYTEKGKKLREKLSKKEHLEDAKKLNRKAVNCLGTALMASREVAKFFVAKYEADKTVDSLIRFLETITEEAKVLAKNKKVTVKEIMEMLERKNNDFKAKPALNEA